ncbi:hypothetical protein M513_12856 [Trichuris suis]|uniref:Uncharacterized protein n=1 Tax=Trichuris suis TaxID=68888 RepID=A0A085LMS2_9BILA|nr:hypothetical protein M513_12856 [Trichuris suis]
MHSETRSSLACARRGVTCGGRLERIYGRTAMNRWEHITGKGSLVVMAHTKRMHSGTCEKEIEQRTQTRENIWPHTNGDVPAGNVYGQKEALLTWYTGKGCTVERVRSRLTSGDRFRKYVAAHQWKCTR